MAAKFRGPLLPLLLLFRYNSLFVQQLEGQVPKFVFLNFSAGGHGVFLYKEYIAGDLVP
jgi:hypothetical protein